MRPARTMNIGVMASALNTLGNVDKLQNRMDAARQHYEQASGIYRELAQQSPEAYLPAVAGTLTNLGVVSGLETRFDESRAYSTEALTIYRKLAQENPRKYATDVARVEINLPELEKKTPSR